MKYRTESEFLNTMGTYVKVTRDRLRSGRIIDAHEELKIMQLMVEQRLKEVEGKAKWIDTDSSINTEGTE